MEEIYWLDLPGTYTGCSSSLISLSLGLLKGFCDQGEDVGPLKYSSCNGSLRYPWQQLMIPDVIWGLGMCSC